MKPLSLTEQLTRVAQNLNLRFTLNGKPLTHEEVFSTSGLLPGMTRRADQLASLCLGYGLGATYEEKEETPLKLEVVFDDITPNVIRLFFLVDVTMELSKGSPKGVPVALDQLLYD